MNSQKEHNLLWESFAMPKVEYPYKTFNFKDFFLFIFIFVYIFIYIDLLTNKELLSC